MILDVKFTAKNQCEIRVTCDECYGYRLINCTPEHDIPTELSRWGWETRNLPTGGTNHYCDDCTITGAPAFGETE